MNVYFSPDEMCTTQKLEVKRISDFFLMNGWNVVEDPNAADIIFCVTCSGWQKLERNSLMNLQELKKYKGRLISLGCTNNVNSLGVRSIHDGECISAHNFSDVERLIPNIQVPFRDIPEPSTFRRREDYRLYDLSKRFINICGGCSFNCIYCPHKMGLGKLSSRTIGSIVGQIKELLNEGLKIVVLTGMETALYGLDINTSYPSLLKEVMELPGDFEIHVAQFNPLGIAKYYDELLPLFQNCRITDIQVPIQTNSERLLKIMQRPLTVNEVHKFLAAVRSVNKLTVFRTDIIVGCPTETMEELDATLQYAINNFDEIAVYGMELREEVAPKEIVKAQYPQDEVDRRIRYASDFIEKNGGMAHGGQQGDVDLVAIEERKKKIREKKRKDDACV